MAPSARGHGYAAEAIGAVLGVAADHGLSKVMADTTVENYEALVGDGHRIK
ncbi:GNAT family N-acetyltransferase [Paenarthrobacter sp. Z7-10]|uniref:GNAT family N-acetyltransferase n=1 Tax=Paenarthrobacter sp. Z7-10 TaxID=2787635 RepID=UPI0022A9D31F|nr:GNAT family N-acetyltransferase [Paenarthrobacter sp. Z7-10]